MRISIFDLVILNLRQNSCTVPGPAVKSALARGTTYKQARSWAQYIDATYYRRWYPDLPVYRMGKQA